MKVLHSDMTEWSLKILLDAGGFNKGFTVIEIKLN